MKVRTIVIHEGVEYGNEAQEVTQGDLDALVETLTENVNDLKHLTLKDGKDVYIFCKDVLRSSVITVRVVD